MFSEVKNHSTIKPSDEKCAITAFSMYPSSKAKLKEIVEAYKQNGAAASQSSILRALINNEYKRVCEEATEAQN